MSVLDSQNLLASHPIREPHWVYMGMFWAAILKSFILVLFPIQAYVSFLEFQYKRTQPHGPLQRVRRSGASRPQPLALPGGQVGDLRQSWQQHAGWGEKRPGGAVGAGTLDSQLTHNSSTTPLPPVWGLEVLAVFLRVDCLWGSIAKSGFLFTYRLVGLCLHPPSSFGKLICHKLTPGILTITQACLSWDWV